VQVVSTSTHRRPRWLRVREPFNGISHFLGAVLGLVGLLLLILTAWGKPWNLLGCAVYGITLVILFTASTVYHSARVSRARIEKLLVIDQVAIFLLIAGTYTPVCLVPLRGPWGWTLLGIVWGIAIFGILLRVGCRNAPEWITVGLYLVMGWLCVLAYGPLTEALSRPALGWLFAGGFIYTVGAVVFASERPRLWPGVFSSHELWHLFVLGGSTCHFVLMLRFVAPAP
jgi:hemolysin III